MEKQTIYAYKMVQKVGDQYEKGLYNPLDGSKLFCQVKLMREIFANIHSRGEEVWRQERAYYLPDEEGTAMEPADLKGCLDVLGTNGGSIPRFRYDSKGTVFDIVTIYPWYTGSHDSSKVFERLVHLYEGTGPFKEEKKERRMFFLGNILRGIEVEDFSDKRFPRVQEWGFASFAGDNYPGF